MGDRRQFLAGAAGLLVSGVAPACAQDYAVPVARPPIIPLGLQLYTVRRDLERDYARTMHRIRAIGIRQVQANLTQSGKSAVQQRKIYDDLGIAWTSIHAGGDALRKRLAATIDAAGRAGITNITCALPLYPIEQARLMAGPSIADWQRNAEALNRCGMICRGAGMTFAYHNHNLEFRRIGKMVPYDLLLKETVPSLVQMEMDIGWVVAAGADPVAYLRKYPARIHAVHIKDLKRQGVPNTDLKMVGAVVGRGIVDWKKVLPALRQTRVTRAYLEIEPPYVPSAISMVRASFARLDGHI